MNHNPADSNTVLLITNNGMGSSSVELQHKLISSYLSIIDEHDYLPAAICFYTEGVRLVVKGSPVLDQLRSLEKKGVRLLICFTCLKALNLYEEVAVGIVGGMPDIIEVQRQAEKVITL